MSVIFIVLVVFSLQCSRPLRCSPQQLYCEVQWDTLPAPTVVINDETSYYQAFTTSDCKVDFSRYSIVIGYYTRAHCSIQCMCVKSVRVDHQRRAIVVEMQKKPLGMMCLCKKMASGVVAIKTEKIQGDYVMEFIN